MLIKTWGQRDADRIEGWSKGCVKRGETRKTRQVQITFLNYFLYTLKCTMCTDVTLNIYIL